MPLKSLAILWIIISAAANATAGNIAASAQTCLTQKTPLVIAHRGASAYRPEHTLAAYQLAMQQGTDFIEPDLVLTKDGHLIARHENELSDTTDIAERTEFATRKTTKIIDGLSTTGWFSEDFTLAEIKTLRARERIPAIRRANRAYDKQYVIPTLSEVIALVKQYEQQTGKKIGLYPETKHPTYFQYAGRHLDGKPIQQSINKQLIETLTREKFTDPKRIYIQSFEVANLIELQRSLMPAAKIDLPLVQLYGDLSDSSTPFGMPQDILYHRNNSSDLDTLYASLAEDIKANAQFGYDNLAEPHSLQKIKALYAEGIGPWKSSLFPAKPVDPKKPRSQKKLTGDIHPLIRDAKHYGLQIHPYTFRADAVYLSLAADGKPLSIEAEIRQHLDAGISGFFIDQPDIGVKVANEYRCKK